MSELTNNAGAPSSQQPKPRKKRKGWWWKIPLALLVLLFLLILLAPTIASTSPVRNMVLSKVNQSLPGKVAIADWSFGWFSNISITGIEYADPQGNHQASVGAVTINKSLLQLARMSLHDTDVLVRDVTLSGLVVDMTPKPAAKLPAKTPSTIPAPVVKHVILPDLTCNVKVENISGDIKLLGAGGKSATLHLDKQTGVALSLPASGPAQCNATISFASAGLVQVTATIQGIKPGAELDTKALQTSAKLLLAKLDLAPFGEIAKVTGKDMNLAGQLNGQVDLASASGLSTVKGEITGSDLAFGGAILQGDQLTTKSLRIPVDLSMAEGGRLKTNTLAVIVDQASVNVSADLPADLSEQITKGTLDGKGGAANVKVSATGLPALLNALPNTLKLQKGVVITGGKLELSANLNLTAQGLQLNVPLTLSDLSATRDGQKIGPLVPITLNASALAATSAGKPIEPRDIDVKLDSSFISLTAKGATLPTTHVDGNCDLVKLKADLGQIVDLSMIRSGSVTWNIVSRDVGGMPAPDAQIKVLNLGINLPADKDGKSRRLDNATALISVQTQFKDGVLSLSQPARVEASARLLESSPSQPDRLLTEQNVLVLVDGSANLNAKPMTAHLASLSVKVGSNLDSPLVSLTSDPADFLLAGKGGATGALKLHLGADIGRSLQVLAAATGSQPSPLLKSGIFQTNLAVNLSADGAMALSLTDCTTDVNLAAGKQIINEKIATSLSASMAGDHTSAQASADITGSCFTVKLEPTTIHFPDPKATAKPTLAQLIPQVKTTINVTDLAKASQILNAFSPSALTLAGDPVAVAVVASPKADNSVDITTDITSGKIRFMQDDKLLLDEPQLKVSLAVKLATVAEQMLLDLSRLQVATTDGMLTVNISGKFSDLGKTNRMEAVKVDITPDLGKLWPILYAAMPQAKRDQIGEMVLSGKQPWTITADGSYPMGTPDKPLTFQQSLKPLHVAGNVAVDSADYKAKGVRLDKLVLPFSLSNGVLRTMYEMPQNTYKAADPATCNTGTLDLSNITVDMTGEFIRVSMPADKSIAKGVQLNPVLSSTLGKYLSVIFVNTEKASGSLDMKTIRCDRLPLGALMYELDKAKNDGSAEFAVNITNLDLASSGMNTVLSLLKFQTSGQSRVTCNIQDARVAIAAGLCTHKLNLALGQRPISFNGELRLRDNYYNYLRAEVTADMLSGWVGSSDLVKYLPDKVGVQFYGPMTALKLDDSSLKDLAKDALKKQLQQRLLGGGKTTTGNEAKPADKATDAVDTLVDIFGKKKDKKK